jgi:hypothetical protein
MKLYDDLAKYWPIFSAPADYDGEARVRSAGFTPEVVVDEWRRDLIVARKTS